MSNRARIREKRRRAKVIDPSKHEPKADPEREARVAAARERDRIESERLMREREDRERLLDEERAAYWAALTPEQRAAYQRMALIAGIAAMGAR